MGERRDRWAELTERLEIEEARTAAPGLVLRLTGELDVAGALRLRERIERALAAGVESLVIDVRDVSFIDSVSLAVIVAAKRRLASPGRLAVVADGSYVSLILAATGLRTVLDVFADRESAEAFAFG